MPRTTAVYFRPRKHLIALATSAVLLPIGAAAIDLAEGPPGTVEPYVRPNVIISIDDSGSMGYKLDSESSRDVNNRLVPDLANGGWSSNSKRINVLKYALESIFDPSHVRYDSGLLPDGKIRIAWQAMHNNGGSPNALSVNPTGNSSPGQNTNSMRVLEGAHRTNFLNFIKDLSAKSGTPSHTMMQQADAYMRRPLGKNGPWSSNPGGNNAKATEYLGCRRNYHILMTDGRWNGTAHAVTDTDYRDNATNLELPNGAEYKSSNNNTKLYRDTHSGSTLADWAFMSWAKPLQNTNSLIGNIQPTVDYNKAPATENFGKDGEGKDAVLERFWNPRYNPATWPHMVTYTIGFSRMAYTWPGNATLKAPGQGGTASAPTFSDLDLLVPFSYNAGSNGTLPDLITGNISWPQMGSENVRSLDLWHAALNGRGRFYAVERGEDLEKAFRDIFGQINAATDPDFSSSATSGSNITRYDVGRFTAAYEPKDNWKGFVLGSSVKTDGSVVPLPGWNNKNTAELLDAISNIDSRLILSWSNKRESSGAEKGGVSFEWDTSENYLSTEQKTWLKKDTAGNPGTDVKGKERLMYIRGERGKEGEGANDLRKRTSRQGDIINSVVWYVGAPSDSYALKGYSAFVRANKAREPMIYVGGNDGMLHGFSANNGEEKIAYVPKGVIAKLRYLTAQDYDSNHKYFVDGSPMTGDVDMGVGTQDPAAPGYSPNYTPDWRTVLVGTLGLGGKGYFALDVTNPSTGASGSTPAFLKSNASSLVLLDRSRSTFEGQLDCAGLTGGSLAACNLQKEEEADIGHITAQPVLDDANPMRSTQITRMNNNRWAVVMGNGYNSLNQRPVLLVQYLDKEKELVRIQATNDAKGTGNANDNGLAAPRLVDLNGDGRVDVAYAGDNQGNMWKFDLTSTSDSSWGVAFNGHPLFTARGIPPGGGARNKVQPITTAPTVAANDRIAQADPDDPGTRYRVGGMMVAFGTGRNIAFNDPENGEIQSLYSVLDNTRYEIIDTSFGKRLKIITTSSGTCSPIPGSDCIPAPKALGIGPTAAKLVQQEIEEKDGGAAGVIKSTGVTLDKTAWAGGYNGWYIDLPSVGERLLKPMNFYDGSNILNVYSQVPAKGADVDPNTESCESVAVDEERQWLTQINIMDGLRPSVQIIDYNNDGMYTDADANVSRIKVSKGSHNQVAQGDKVQDLNVKNEIELTMARMPEETMRPSWRQVH